MQADVIFVGRAVEDVVAAHVLVALLSDLPQLAGRVIEAVDVVLQLGQTFVHGRPARHPLTEAGALSQARLLLAASQSVISGFVDLT